MPVRDHEPTASVEPQRTRAGARQGRPASPQPGKRNHRGPLPAHVRAALGGDIFRDRVIDRLREVTENGVGIPLPHADGTRPASCPRRRSSSRASAHPRTPPGQPAPPRTVPAETHRRRARRATAPRRPRQRSRCRSARSPRRPRCEDDLLRCALLPAQCPNRRNRHHLRHLHFEIVGERLIARSEHLGEEHDRVHARGRGFGSGHRGLAICTSMSSPPTSRYATRSAAQRSKNTHSAARSSSPIDRSSCASKSSTDGGSANAYPSSSSK